MPLLEVQDLVVSLPTARGMVDAVRGVGFSLEPGDTLGMVGESGCGKSLTALALMGLLPEGARTSGRILLDGEDLLAAGEPALCRIRGNRMAMVFQEPMSALNPLHRVADQIGEPLRLHRGWTPAAARHEAVRLLDRVGIADASRRADAYPHELSGGQRQRVMIAMALSCEPALLIADEPTTALDVTVQAQILALMGELVAERGMALILISHDLGVIAGRAARTMVMYGGSVVESGPTHALFARRAHPYTRGLFAARPRLGAQVRERLPTIAGSVPALADLESGCPFASRCDWAMDACRDARPDALELAAGHAVRCIRPEAMGPGAAS